MKYLYERIKADTPIFFKKLQLWSAFIGGTCTLAYNVPNLPPQLYVWLGYGICGTVVSIAMAQCTKIDTPNLPQ